MAKILNRLIRTTEPLGKTIMGEWVEWRGKWYFIVDMRLQLYRQGKVKLADLIEEVKARYGHTMAKPA